MVLQERFILEFEQKKTTETSENDAKQRGDGRRERRSVQLVRFEYADSILLLPRHKKYSGIRSGWQFYKILKR